MRSRFAIAITLLCAVATAFSVSGQEAVRFTDDFSGSLDAWPVKNYAWTLQSGQLVGDFLAYCDNNRPWCQEGDLILADEHQPRTSDWRLDVDFKAGPNVSPYGATNGQGALVMFAFTTTYRDKEVYSIGNGSWTSGTTTTAEMGVRTFGPWTTVATSSIPLNWDPSVFNKATLEKRGSTISFFLNGHLIGTVSRAARGKIGLHVKGSCVFDNFKVTEIGTPPAYTIAGTILKKGGVPMKGVTVTTSPGNRTATTDENGAYSVSGLDDRTTYTVTPSYSDGSGNWTFSQPLYIETILGGSLANVNFMGRRPGTERETVRFTDDFSGTLSAWVSKGGGWWIEGGRLRGQYSVYCGDTKCPHTFLLLADQYQPRTADWRMEVDFTLADAPWIFHDADTYFALWESETAAEVYFIGWSGDNWDGAPRTVAQMMSQTYAPTWLSGYHYDLSTPLWDPKQWNRAKLEKRGDVFFFYLNDHLLGVETGSILTKPKLGFHIYGTTLLDNFKLTELDDGTSTVADLRVTQEISPSTIHAGDSMAYTLTVSNLGPSTASEVTLTDALPPGASVVGATGTDWNCTAGSTVTCTRASLASGGVASVVITCRAPSAQSETYLVNTAVVGSLAEDPVLDNNTSKMTVEVALQPEAIPVLDPRSVALIEACLAMIGVIALARRR